VEYLEYAEIQAVLAAVDRTTADGERDYTLLATLFNTGARVPGSRQSPGPGRSKTAGEGEVS